MDHDAPPAIAVVGMVRCGTTWLAQLLQTLPGAAVLYEPLLARTNPEAAKIGVVGEVYRPAAEDWPELEDYLRRVFLGRVKSDSLLRMENDPPREPVTWIVKFAHANRLLPWMARRYPEVRFLWLVRHPCAVVASILPRRTPAQLAALSSRSIAHLFPEWTGLLSRLETPEEHLAAKWSLNHLVPLAEPKPAWERVTYERLLRDVKGELGPVLSSWGYEMPPALQGRVDLPSITTTDGTPGFPRRTDRLARWREVLSDGQIRRILAVVEAFGVDVYDESLDPSPSFRSSRRPAEAGR
ncbi:MAG: sulfotransferase [Thermoanaerobaculia bacterium]|nr:sulfotransferase [Thermoanaerobaculia bacterium]